MHKKEIENDQIKTELKQIKKEINQKNEEHQTEINKKNAEIKKFLDSAKKEDVSIEEKFNDNIAGVITCV